MTLAPDLVILNGKIVTVDRDFSIAEAMAVKDGRILVVGKNIAIRPLAGGESRILDLKGKTMLPGINDAHIHAQWFGTKMPPLALDVSPRKVKSIREIVQLVGERAKTLNPGEWIRGSGLTLHSLEEYAVDPKRYPNKACVASRRFPKYGPVHKGASAVPLENVVDVFLNRPYSSA